ncbi:MAG: lipocalin [Wenzhouxiangella sp.]|nr:MAG: lipocalin [Wenzhouxiangella sp.]
MLAGLMLVGMSHAQEPLKLVDDVDLERYQGTWYEIALLPNRFQRRCLANTRADYRLLEQGRVEVTNRCQRSDGSWIEVVGEARRAGDDLPAAALEVRFAPRWLAWLPMVWGEYRIIALDDDYQLAMVGTEDRRFLWILARQPDVAEDRLAKLLDLARAQGFETEKLSWTPHDDR